MHYEYKDEALTASFDLPDDPDFGQVVTYEEKRLEAFAGKDELPNHLACAANVYAAAEAGLISMWDVKTRPGMSVTNRDRQSGKAIIWAGNVIYRYMQQLKFIDPKSFAPVLRVPAES